LEQERNEICTKSTVLTDGSIKTLTEVDRNAAVRHLDNHKRFMEIVDRWYLTYAHLRSVKRFLEALVFIRRNIQSNRILWDLILQDMNLSRIRIVVDDDGNLQISFNPFLEAIHGVDITRIRECPICRHFFWAGRKDKGYCSRQCADVVNQ
jgi:hypothetical protein